MTESIQWIIDGAALPSREELHTQAAAALELPAYYGRNLDALYDCLCEKGQPVHITVQNRAALRQRPFGRALLRLLQEAAAQNACITLTMEEELPTQ